MKRLLTGIVLIAGVVEAALSPLPKGKLPDPAGLKINQGRTIQFLNPLPRMRCGKQACGTYNNWELAYPGVLTTRDHNFGDVLWHLRKVVWADRRQVFIDGRVLMCQLNWIRDHIHQMKGYCHWEYDLTSFLDFILDTQRADGQFYELIKQLDDYHWTFVNPDCRVLYPEDNQSLVRLELEADIEYLMVEGCLQAWRVTGDDAWLKKALPRLEKGIDYQTSDIKRWDAERGLCKRPYTIDTWDFTADPLSGQNRTIQLEAPMAAMHGDNTGVYQAMLQLAWINERFGNPEKAQSWRARAETLRANIMKHLWNGKFFCHQLPLNCKPQDENESKRLSMSDAYALNRGILTPDLCRSIIDEYRARRKTTKAFAEWFTIDPPYGKFKEYPAGEYVNGAICPFTAGELAKGAFENGYETYGWDILERLSKMVLRDQGRIFFLYHPTTGEPQGRGPSAWGAAAILSAVDQGLAGIQDQDTQYRKLRFAPRWAVSPYTEGRYLTGYEFSKKKVDVRWVFTDKGFRYHLESPAEEVNAHLLVPSGKTPRKLLVNGVETTFTLSDVYGSKYVDVVVKSRNGIADFEVLYASNEVTRYGVKITKEKLAVTAAPKVLMPQPWRIVEGNDALTGLDARDYYFTLEAPGAKVPAPEVSVEWAGVAIKNIYGATQVKIAGDKATFKPTAKKVPTHFSSVWADGPLRMGIFHNVEGVQHGPYAGKPYPVHEVKAQNNWLFAARELFKATGLTKDEIGGTIPLFGFESNFPNGHVDSPPHFHIMLAWTKWDDNNVGHFHVDSKGRILDNAFMLQGVPKTFRTGGDSYAKCLPGNPAVPYYGEHRRVSFEISILKDGSGLEVSVPGRAEAWRIQSEDAVRDVGVFVRITPSSAWTELCRVAADDDSIAGVLTVDVSRAGKSSREVIRYVPETGRLIE